MVEFFFQLSRLQKLYKSRIFPNSSFQNEDACWFPSTDGWSLLLKYNDVMFWTVDQTENGFLFNQLLGFLTVLLKISKKITQNNCILMAAKWIICHKVNDDLFLPFAKCLQTVRLLPLLFSDIDLFHLEEKRGAERQRGLEKRGNDTNHLEININMSKTSRAG